MKVRVSMSASRPPPWSARGLGGRGRRHPAAAHAGAVGAAHRLHCAARSGVAPLTRCTRFARYAQTDAASQFTKRAARADPSPALLVAPEIASAGCRLPRWHRWIHSTKPNKRSRSVIPACARLLVFALRTPTVAARQALPAGGDFCGGAERSLEVGVRSTHPPLTRPACLSIVSAANDASSGRDFKASTTAESARSADRHSMSPLRVAPAAPGRPAHHASLDARSKADQLT